MRNKLFRFISLILIFNLFFTRGLITIPLIYGEDVVSPTTGAAQTSTSSPTSPPSAPKPPSSAQPTSPPNSNGAGNLNPTSPPTTTGAPTQPTNAPPTSGASQNVVSPTVNPSSGGSNNAESNSNSTGSNNDASNSTSNAGGNNQSGGDLTNTGSGGSDSTQGSTSVNDPANIGTGPLSNNYAAEVNKKAEEIVNKNLADLQNKINAVSNTGFNYANLNTLQGQVFTGDAVSSLNLLNKLNSNMTGLGGFSVFNVYGNQSGDINFQFADNNSNNSFASASPTISKNSQTGPGSTNNGLADNTFTVKEANGNDAKLVNDINLQAVTGGNSASFNTGGGYIKTGNALALGNIVNLANTNLNVSQWLFGVVNIFGSLQGNILLPKDTNNSNGTTTTAASSVLAENSNTGPGSTNTASFTNSEATNMTTNNSADIVSNLGVSANTGNNTASINTGGGSVTTGMADASVSNSTIANVNTVNDDGTVWMVIVNEMGKWVGHIYGAPWGSTTASNSLPITQTGGGAGSQTYATTALNNSTGPLSTNNATYNSSSDVAAQNDNTASITNNITANADTGNNNSAYNTGAGIVETGNAKVGLNIVNMANTNITAKKFVAVLVNVLGSFLGNIIPPDQQTGYIAANSSSKSGNIEPTPGSSNQPKPTGVKSPLQPAPTTYQIPAFTNSDTNLAGASQQNTTSNQGNYSPVVSDYSSSGSQASSYSTYNYIQAQNHVRTVKNKVYGQTQLLSTPEPAIYRINQNNGLRRGLFVSTAFAKATESSSMAGILLGGATLRVNESWLSILPFALFIFLLRRRRKYNLMKYLNSLLEVVL